MPDPLFPKERSFEAEGTFLQQELLSGQGLIFDMPPVLKARDGPTTRRRASAAIGDEGETIFETAIKYADPPFSYVRHPIGNPDSDFYVTDWEVQVKASETIQRDGRILFQAGRKKFIDYSGIIDFWVFVYVDHKSEMWGRMLILPASEVFRHWCGRTAYLYPVDLPAVRDLSPLRQQRSAIRWTADHADQTA